MVDGLEEPKLEAAELFARDVVRGLKGVYAIYLFGSVAKGTAGPESDVDVLVVLASKTEEAYDVLARASSRAYERTGQVVEFVVMDIEEFLRLRPTSPFLYEVEKWGKALYLDGGQVVERAKALARLADEYASSARAVADMGMIRLAVDALHNAVELLLKALIILRGKPLPKTHGGYIHVSGELYVAHGEVPRKVLRDLMKGLEVRNKARYEPGYTPTISDLELLEGLYKELRGLLIKELGKPISGPS